YNSEGNSGDDYRPCASAGLLRENAHKFDRALSQPLFGSPAKGHETIRCDDVTKDTRYPDLVVHRNGDGRFPIRSYLAVPLVLRSGEVIGGLFFVHSVSGIF